MTIEIIPLAEIDKETLRFDTKKKIPYYAYKELLVEFMKLNQIENLEISFSGSGDSGDIDFIDGIPDEIENVDFYGKRFISFVNDFAYHVLQLSGYDWYNNDGGYGTVKINSSEGTVHLDMHIARTEYDNYEEQY